MLVITQLKKINHITIFKCLNDIRIDCPRKNVTKNIIKSFEIVLNNPSQHIIESELQLLTKNCSSFQPNLTFYQQQDMDTHVYALTEKELLTNGKTFRYNYFIDWERQFKNFANL